MWFVNVIIIKRKRAHISTTNKNGPKRRKERKKKHTDIRRLLVPFFNVCRVCNSTELNTWLFVCRSVRLNFVQRSQNPIEMRFWFGNDTQQIDIQSAIICDLFISSLTYALLIIEPLLCVNAAILSLSLFHSHNPLSFQKALCLHANTCLVKTTVSLTNCVTLKNGAKSKEIAFRLL